MRKLYYYTPQTDYVTPSSVMAEINHSLDNTRDTPKNLYETPGSMSKVSETRAASEGQEFYVVSNTKFLVLYIATFGMYNLYWFYKNWKLHEQYTNKTIFPVLRTIFANLFTHFLFSAVKSKLQAKGQSFNWSPGILATAIVIMTITSNVVGILSVMRPGTIGPAVAILMLVLIMAFVFSKAQAAINYACGDPDGDSNKTFGLGNITWTVIGGSFWLLNVFSIITLLAAGSSF